MSIFMKQNNKNTTNMKLALIAALANNRVIGKDNQLIWHLPEDLKHFKKLTTGHHIIMGRKTFESIGKPLPNRVNIVISRNETFRAPGAFLVSSLDQAIKKARPDALPFIVGGATIYKEALNYVTDMYLTIIDKDFEGDAYFPKFKESDWQIVSESKHTKEGPDGFDYRFVHYQKK